MNIFKDFLEITTETKQSEEIEGSYSSIYPTEIMNRTKCLNAKQKNAGWEKTFKLDTEPPILNMLMRKNITGPSEIRNLKNHKQDINQNDANIREKESWILITKRTERERECNYKLPNEMT